MASRLLFALAATAAASPFPKLFVRDSPYDLSTPINASLPNVTIFATGGTIASQGTSNTQTVGYSVGLGVEQLVDAVPEILNISNINGIQVSNTDSGSINKTILLNLAHLINTELSKPEISGVVITHGTDTLEETAFFLDLVTNSSKPVVCVGAMRPATALSADGPLNLYQAVTLAISPNARDRGAMITLNDRIGNTFYTTKNNANSLDTFFSTEARQLGFFIDQVPYFYYAPSKPIGLKHFDISNKTDLPKVDILYSHQDMDPSLFASAYTAGAEGLVFAGVGAGGWSRAASTAAETLFNATNVPIVASHRSVDGFVPNSEGDFVIGSGFYNPQKARVLLQLALAKGFGLEEIREVFALSYPMP
ncbi:L-asparaginase 2-4 [Pseudocercospora fuligena]|uniref:asparaginase n=1 Tax=Pseudocercospora fuligena TaxID=685502 RepID=A0A8H6VIB5_9PEZI|nr:L-asparaginase 2-4 [Pseudocercospora fuligena]